MDESKPEKAARDDAAAEVLSAAARTWGIETVYWDVWFREHRAPVRVQKAILESLGVAAGSSESLEQALEERRWQEWRHPLPPTVLLTSGQLPHELVVSMPADRAQEQALIEIRGEGGVGPRRIPFALSEVPVAEQATLRGQQFVRKRLLLPSDLPLGYHEVAVQIGQDLSPAARLIVCPARAYQPPWLETGKTAGIAVSLYGVRSARNWGCGDVTDLKAIIDWAAEQTGASFIALNPLHAIPNREPYNISPYLPNSIYYRNPLYLDIEQMEDFRASRRAGPLFKSEAVWRELSELRAGPFVEYGRVYRLKLRFLKLLFRTFLKEWLAATPRACEFSEYIRREGELLRRFAIHSALDEAIHRRHPDIWNWPDWPEEYRDPESDAVRDFGEKHWPSVLFHMYLQWQLDLQLASAQEQALERGMRIGLYHDLALATDRFGADLWSHPEFFVAGCRVGAPPDTFSPKGQDWAFPPPSAERHYRDGYSLFSESIRKNARHGGALRIDHVMRFFRLFWIPDGMQATEGTYVRDRRQDLVRILALESVRGKFLVVGEDLGTVPDEIRQELHRAGILSYRLLYFEQDRDGRFHAPPEYPRDALVSATTHDLPTLAGFWLGRDIEARRNAGLLPDEATYLRMREERAQEKQRMLDLVAGLGLLPESFPRNAGEVGELEDDLHNAIVGLLASTPAKLLVLNQEDLLKETEQQNLPGTTEEYPNWRRKMKCTVEELWASGRVREFARMFREWMERAGRV